MKTNSTPLTCYGIQGWRFSHRVSEHESQGCNLKDHGRWYIYNYIQVYLYANKYIYIYIFIYLFIYLYAVLGS